MLPEQIADGDRQAGKSRAALPARDARQRVALQGGPS